MAAPISLEKLVHLATHYTKHAYLNKCLAFPFVQTPFYSYRRSFSDHEVNKSRKGTAQVCMVQPSSARSTNLQLQLHRPLHSLLGDKSISIAPWFFIQARYYGRKVKPKPPKITNFEYSGDLRTLPEIDKNVLLYPFVDLEDDMDDTVRKLTSFEFASVTEQNKHLKQLVQDRIIELFGADSELEQEIARLTLRIRQMIPYCIRMRTDKGNKVWLLKTIFRRRRLLNRLRHLDHERFEWLLRELKIRYVIPRDKEEFKGWKHNLREATKEETLMEQRRKLKDLREKMNAEKEEFYKQKAAIMADIEKDMEKFGLGQDFLDSVLVKERLRKEPDKILTWDERVKLGMTGKIKDYYG